MFDMDTTDKLHALDGLEWEGDACTYGLAWATITVEGDDEVRAIISETEHADAGAIVLSVTDSGARYAMPYATTADTDHALTQYEQWLEESGEDL